MGTLTQYRLGDDVEHLIARFATMATSLKQKQKMMILLAVDVALIPLSLWLTLQAAGADCPASS